MVDAAQFLDTEVEVFIDRPMGSRHPEHGFLYPINYGYVPGTIGPDGEPIDAYVLGESAPLDRFVGCCIAVIRRLDDDDDKLVVVEAGGQYTDEQIIARTDFQERFFASIILRSK